MRSESFTPAFVEYIPRTLEPHTLYISESFAITAHLCACGCGTKVFLPLSPAEWRIEDREAGVTLRPSVGNWDFPCRSHYFITRGRVEWAREWDSERVETARLSDQRDLHSYFRSRERVGFWRRLWRRLSQRP